MSVGLGKMFVFVTLTQDTILRKNKAVTRFCARTFHQKNVRPPKTEVVCRKATNSLFIKRPGMSAKTAPKQCTDRHNEGKCRNIITPVQNLIACKF